MVGGGVRHDRGFLVWSEFRVGAGYGKGRGYDLHADVCRFLFGYLVVAFVLLPLYYKLNLTSIYAYLDVRFGKAAYRTGASFFLLSKMLGAAARLYLVCLILQNYVFGSLGVPFEVTASGTVS